MSTKTRKLICQVTGKPLFASKEYFEKKVQKAGSENELHRTYICRDALTLLKKGYTIDDVRSSIEIYNDFECILSDEDTQSITGNTTSLRINTNDRPTIGVIKTDPAVVKFLKKILKNE